MVDITIPDAKRKTIAKQYYDRLVNWIDKKVQWAIADDAMASEMMDYIHTNSREFFLASACRLKAKSNKFSRRFAGEKQNYDEASRDDKPATSYGRFMRRMRDIYNGFMQDIDDEGVKNGYWLMKQLNIRVCPYCNSNYTICIDEDTVQVRPEYDHFYPESKYPSLILSFYNLVPSCPQCNHLKRAQELKVNPWKGYNAVSVPKFMVDTSKGDFPATPKILIKGENNNTKKLGIRELYNEHTDYVKDILNKIQAYNPATYKTIAKDFQGIVYTEAELERMIWGNYTNIGNADKRPFAKLTADILEQYKKYL